MVQSVSQIFENYFYCLLIIHTWDTGKSTQFANRAFNIRLYTVHTIYQAFNYLNIFQLVSLAFIFGQMNTYVHWYFHHVIITFRKFIGNFLKIIRLAQYQSIKCSKNFYF